MTDNSRPIPRDLRGRFRKVDPERDVIAPDLGTPREFAYGLQRRYAPAGDTLAGTGPSYPDDPGGQPHAPLRAGRTAVLTDGGSAREVYASPLRARNPEMAHPDEIAGDARDVHGEVLRSAARDAGDMDPSYALVTAFGTHGAGRAGQEVSDGRA